MCDGGHVSFPKHFIIIAQASTRSSHPPAARANHLRSCLITGGLSHRRVSRAKVYKDRPATGSGQSSLTRYIQPQGERTQPQKDRILAISGLKGFAQMRAEVWAIIR